MIILSMELVHPKESWKVSVETDVPYIFFKTAEHLVLTWSSRYSLIGMCTEAQLGILFRASVGHRKPSVKTAGVR